MELTGGEVRTTDAAGKLSVQGCELLSEYAAHAAHVAVVAVVATAERAAIGCLYPELVVSECRNFGVNAIAAKCDLTSEGDREHVVQLAKSQFGKLSILVNNAGGGGPKPFDMPMSDFEWAFQLNLFSAFRLCQLCAAPMRDFGGGAIINIIPRRPRGFRMIPVQMALDPRLLVSCPNRRLNLD